jgi:hypothetical protein
LPNWLREGARDRQGKSKTQEPFPQEGRASFPQQGTKAAMHRKYRSLERQCHIQLALTGHKEARQELEKKER